VSELPPSWAWTTLEDLAGEEPRAITDGPFGSNLKSSHYVDSGPRVIRLQNIGFGKFIDEPAHITEAHFEYLRAHEARAGDLIVASLGQDLPRACLVPPSVGLAIVKADCIRVRLHSEVNPKYVNYALQRPALRHTVADQIHGVGRPRLGMAGIKQLSIPLPPLAEQERIVTAIEEHISRLDAAEAALLDVSARLARFEDLVYRQVLELAAERRPLGDFARTASGGTPRRSRSEFFGGPIPWIKSGELGDGIVTQTEETITEAALEESSAKLVPEGTVLIAMYGATIGKLGRVGVSMATTNQAVAAMYPCERLTSDFLWNVLRALRSDLVRFGQGGAQPNISQSILRKLEIPVPSLTEQIAANAGIERSISVWRATCRAVAAAQRRAASLRRSVLTAAFSARLVPQAPHDEPALALLKRIRAERIAATPAKKKQREAT
jgi:type I restriction enzyme S subunit